ncbi:MAG: 50S ribosomal protein L6 [Desulfurococcaceae archaeon]
MPKMLHVVEFVEIPPEVAVEVNGLQVKVSGPKGVLIKDFSHAKGVSIRVEEKNVVVEAFRANRELKALVGTIAAHIRNMITGVTKGYRYKLKVIYSHFPVTVVVDEKNKVVRIKNFLGEKADRIAKIHGNVKVRVEGQDIIVEGIDIEEVGLTASALERATKIRDLDRRIFADGIYIYERGVIE